MSNIFPSFFAYFDIMGFKDRIYRNQTKKEILTVYNSLLKINKAFDEISKACNPISANNSYASVEKMIFSDCYVLYTKPTNNFITRHQIQYDLQSVKQLMSITSAMLLTCLKHGFPLKGAMSYGHLCIDLKSDILFGIPIVDAYSLSEKLGMFGIVLHHSIENKIAKLPQLKKDNSIIDYLVEIKVPIKGAGESEHKLIVPKNDIKSLIESISAHKLKCSGETRTYVDKSIEIYSKIQ